MRLFEIIILAITILSFILFLIQLKKPSWLYLLPSLSLLAFAYHLFFEGARWQMIPLYLLALGLIYFGFRKITHPDYRIPKAITVISLILLLIGAALPITLPVPTFPTKIGRASCRERV